MTVAIAAPATPSFGIPKSPKISTGSKKMLITAPTPCVIMEYKVFPVDCKSFSKISCAYRPNEHTHTIVRYCIPNDIISGSAPFT